MTGDIPCDKVYYYINSGMFFYKKKEIVMSYFFVLYLLVIFAICMFSNWRLYEKVKHGVTSLDNTDACLMVVVIVGILIYLPVAFVVLVMKVWEYIFS